MSKQVCLYACACVCLCVYACLKSKQSVAWINEQASVYVCVCMCMFVCVRAFEIEAIRGLD